MGQQPNVELTEATRPRSRPQPGPALKWRSSKPGIPAGPTEVPSGGRFGRTGPDHGWALRLVGQAELPDDDPKLRAVVTGLVQARASALGRAPVPEDIEVALVLCGYTEDAPEEVRHRLRRWLDAVPHEMRPGETAAREVDPDLLVRRPDQIRYALRRLEQG